MDTAQSQSSPMVVQSLDLNNDDIRLCALIYLKNCIGVDIAFVVNLLVRYSAKCHP